MKKSFLFIAPAILLLLLHGCNFMSDEEEKKVDFTSTDSLNAYSAGSGHFINRLLRDSLGRDSILKIEPLVDTVQNNLPLPKGAIDIKNTHPAKLVDFAQTLIGIPYSYGSTNAQVGFDCSGFVTYVFNHFNIAVPRSSIDFTNVGREVRKEDAKPGDLILFTGTDSTKHFVGHMGIVVSNNGGLQFIHSTSGKKYGVTISPLEGYYEKRFVKTIRIFPQNG